MICSYQRFKPEEPCSKSIFTDQMALNIHPEGSKIQYAVIRTQRRVHDALVNIKSWIDLNRHLYN